MSKQRLLKKVEILQGRVQELWSLIDYGMPCQEIMKHLNTLQSRIESGEIKPKKP
jgi:DNA-binding FrmR family transcriptional regulator